MMAPASSLPRVPGPGSRRWCVASHRGVKAAIVVLTLAVACLSTVSRGGELTNSTSLHYLGKASRMDVSRKQAVVEHELQVSRTPPQPEEPVKVAESFPGPEQEAVPPYKAPVIPLNSLRSPPAGF